MNELLKKIFNNVISQEEDFIKMFKHVDEEIEKLIEPYMEQLSDEELEEIKDFMYETADYLCYKTTVILSEHVINLKIVD